MFSNHKTIQSLWTWVIME